jgi:hypothetical protein
MEEMMQRIRDLLTIAWAYIIGFFSVRLFRIDENLYQSGHLHGLRSKYALGNATIYCMVDLEGGIDKIATDMVWYRYWPIYDGALPDLLELWEIAREIQKMTELGNRVLTHCQGGCNRSSLVNGCVLYLRGYRGRAIVKKIREGRPGALTNTAFTEYLERLV